MKPQPQIKTKDYSLVGNPADFYVFVFKDNSTSGWIKGKANVYYSLLRSYEESKSLFNRECFDLIGR